MFRKNLLKFLVRAPVAAAIFWAVWAPIRPFYNQALADAAQALVPLFEKPRITTQVYYQEEKDRWLFRRKDSAGKTVPRVKCAEVTYSLGLLAVLAGATPGMGLLKKTRFMAATAALLFLWHLAVIEILAKHQYVFLLGEFSAENFHWSESRGAVLTWLKSFAEILGNQSIAFALWAPAGIQALRNPEPAPGLLQTLMNRFGPGPLSSKGGKNPLRNAKPNAPCPCGSGIKFKKCHGKKN